MYKPMRIGLIRIQLLILICIQEMSTASEFLIWNMCETSVSQMHYNRLANSK